MLWATVLIRGALRSRSGGALQYGLGGNVGIGTKVLFIPELWAEGVPDP